MNVFNTLTLKQIFWKMKSFFKKLEYHVLVESTKIENAALPYKTALPETNVKTNSQRTVFYQQLLNICFQFKNLLQKLIWCTNYRNVRIHTFCQRWSFIFGCFSMRVSLKRLRQCCIELWSTRSLQNLWLNFSVFSFSSPFQVSYKF